MPQDPNGKTPFHKKASTNRVTSVACFYGLYDTIYSDLLYGIPSMYVCTDVYIYVVCTMYSVCMSLRMSGPKDLCT